MMDCSVLIVGAGPVGLSLALELGRRGIDVIVLEQLDRGGHQPRAKTTNVRSMAHFRRWGLAEQVRNGSPLSRDYPRDIIFATRLFGVELARFPNAFFGDQRQPDDRFPEPAQWIPQYKIEAVLRDAIAGYPNISLRFGHRLMGLKQDADVVMAEVAVDDVKTVLSTSFLVGADGGRSDVRQLLGVNMEGDPAYMRNFLAVYRAPGLADRIPLDPAISYWLVNPDAAAVTGPMDDDDRWFFSTQLKGEATNYDLVEARRRIGAAIGADVPFEIIETDTWSAHRLLADRYRVDRVFLAGDACHLHPPMGGYGMNMGIGDAVDLGWKLAAVLAGWGGEGLLDSYAEERRAVARLVIDEAAKNYSFVTHHMVREKMEGNDAASAEVRAELGGAILSGKEREFRALNVVLGLCYTSAVIIPDGSEAPTWDPIDYIADARPGALAPHHWLLDGTSLYDSFGEGFTLLVLDKVDDAETRSLARAAEDLNIPLKIVCIDGDPELAKLYGARLTLIRPDQHVAWRSNSLDRTADLLLATISGRNDTKHIRSATA